MKTATTTFSPRSTICRSRLPIGRSCCACSLKHCTVLTPPRSSQRRNGIRRVRSARSASPATTIAHFCATGTSPTFSALGGPPARPERPSLAGSFCRNQRWCAPPCIGTTSRPGESKSLSVSTSSLTPVAASRSRLPGPGRRALLPQTSLPLRTPSCHTCGASRCCTLTSKASRRSRGQRSTLDEAQAPLLLLDANGRVAQASAEADRLLHEADGLSAGRDG